MKILFLMDPFVDIDWTPKRNFVLANDLGVTKMSFPKNAKDEVHFLCLESILKPTVKDKLLKNNVHIHIINDDEFLKVVKQAANNVISVIENNFDKNSEEQLISFFRRKFPKIKFDLVIYWEYVSDIMFKIFSNTTFMEGSHSGLYRLENNVDVFYILKRNGYYDYSFVNMIKEHKVSNKSIEHIEQFKSYLNNNILFDTNITRDFLDPEHKFEKILFYPMHFQSNRFVADTNYATQVDFINYILSVIPSNFAIAVTSHPLNDKCYINNDRVIDLSEYQKIDSDLSLRIIKITDGLINVYSSIFIFAMLLDKPIFSFGRDLYAKFCTCNIEDIERYFSDKVSNITKEYRDFSLRLLDYTLTRKLNLSMFQYRSTTTMYIRRIVNSLSVNKNFQSLIQLSTVEGYFHQFKTNYLIEQKLQDTYVENTELTDLYRSILIPTIKNIGFDIFDTLLQRPFYEPVQLFDLMAPKVDNILNLRTFGFKNVRILSEQVVRKNKIEVTLDDIYEKMEELTGISHEKIEKIKLLELYFEARFLKPRYFVKNIFELAKIHKKKVFIASDMYLSKEFLIKVLTEKGYDLDGVSVYVSSEVNKVKHDGSLFREIIKLENLDPKETLFIGDNGKSDKSIPEKLGINSFLIPKAIEQIKKTKPFQMSELKTLYGANWSLHIPMIANVIFDNPFIKYNYETYTNNSSRLLGYFIFGPVVTSVIYWLVDEISDKNYEEILFAARDSKLIMELYDYINQKVYNHTLPKSKYAVISRTALLPCFHQKDSMINLVNLYVSNLDIVSFLNKFFDISLDKDKKAKKLINKYKINKLDFAKYNISQLVSFLNDYYNEVDFDNIKVENISKYLNSLIKGRRVAMFDLGTRATAKDAIENITDKKVDCYLFRCTKYKFEKRVKGYFSDSLNPYRTGIKKVLPSFYETILSDNLTNTCEGYSYDEVSHKISPIVSEKQKLTTSDILILNTQSMIKEFTETYVETFGEYTKNINIDSKDVFILPLSRLSSGFMDRELLEKYYHDDPLGKNEDFPIIPNLLTPQKKNILSPISSRVNIQVENDNKKRELFIKYKRIFYKSQLGKRIWDFGRKKYLQFKGS